MKMICLLSLFTITTSTLAASEWKPFAETINCAEKVLVLAKDGEKFVKVVKNGKEENLYAKNETPFQKDTPHKILYLSNIEDKKLGDETYTFVQPAMMESILPKIEISRSGVQHRCDMKMK